MFNAIMAFDEKGGFTKNGTLPWPKNIEDLRFFKEMTLNNIVVMGSKTWNDPIFPAPLPNRVNVVISSKSKYSFPGADYVFGGNSEVIANKLLELSTVLDKPVFIIGGKNVIEQFFNYIRNFYVTIIPGEYDCDEFLDIEKFNKFKKIDVKKSANTYIHYSL